MLVLSRKNGQTIHIGPDITVTIVRCENGRVRIGIDAPSHVPILRDDAVKLQSDDYHPRPVSPFDRGALMRTPIGG